MLPAWLVIALVFLRPALEASAFIGFGFPGEVTAILGGVAALCRYRGRFPGIRRHLDKHLESARAYRRTVKDA